MTDMDKLNKIQLIFRLAVKSDIPHMEQLRLAVKENRLADPSKIKTHMYEDYLDVEGCTWVCEVLGKVVGFGAANKHTANIWALFICEDFESLGIGQKLMSYMLSWLHDLGHKQANLSTESGTRAEKFYKMNGWQIVQHNDNEIEFVKNLRE